MLAVFSQTVAQNPDCHKNQHTGSVDLLKDETLVVKHFQSMGGAAVIFKFGSSALMAYSQDSRKDSGSWSFDSRGDIFCLFKGSIENVINEPKDWMGPANYTARVIEAYKAEPPPPPGFTNLLILKKFIGNFALILYDANAKRGFVHIAGPNSYGLFWGSDTEGSMVVADDPDVVEQACPKHCSPLAADFGRRTC